SCAWSARRDRRSCRPSWRSFGSLAVSDNSGVGGQSRLRPFRPQLAQQGELGLEIHVVRQLQMLDEARRLHAVAVREHAFLVLCRRHGLLAELTRTQGAVEEGHGHGLAFTVAEGETIAARELGRLVGTALELVYHLAFGERDGAERDLEAQLVRLEDDLHLAHPDLAGKGVRAPVAALRRIAEREQEAFVPARQCLEAQVAIGWKGHGIAR